MTVVSVYFLMMVCAMAFVYYIVPKKWQWMELLVCSVLFYALFAVPYTFVFLLVSVAVTYITTRAMARGADKGDGWKKGIQVLTVIAMVVNVGLWFVFKGQGLWSVIPGLKGFSPLPFASALGMGYYTLQLIGYLLDCAWGNVTPLKNPLKLLLFTCFFPQMTTGPISRFSELESMFQGRAISYENITHGSQRVLWGFFKKLVIAERVGIMVNAVYNNLEVCDGFYRWIALLIYPVQMYADFSGAMDMMLGVAEIFGIRLPENFDSPFFSKNSKEFWRRWHITLGTWTKDYVLYPLLKSNVMVKLGKLCKKRFGKKTGKFIVTQLGMVALWGTIGIWHGTYKQIVGVSLWYFMVLLLGELCEPLFKKINQALKIKEECFGWRLFQMIRTYIIYAVGIVFFRAATIKGGFAYLGSLFGVFAPGKWNPEIFVQGDTLLTLGVKMQDIVILLISVALLIIVGILREKHGYARNWVDKRCLPVRWALWSFLFLFVILYGKYGSEYDSVNFIYQLF